MDLGRLSMSTTRRGGSTWLRAALILGPIAIGLVVGGCSPKAASGSLEEATVTGQVTIKGKPVGGGGTVTFNPANASRKDVAPRETKINAEGRYTITTLLGHNTATVRIPKPPRDADLRRAGKGVHVVSGSNTLDLEIPAMPVPAAKAPTSARKTKVVEER